MPSTDLRYVVWPPDQNDPDGWTLIFEAQYEPLPNGIEHWEINREIELWGDGGIRGKRDRPGDFIASELPNVPQAIQSGEMKEISAAEFNRLWSTDVEARPRSLLNRLLGR